MPTPRSTPDSLPPYARLLLFHSACQRGQPRIVENLLQKPIDLNSILEETTALYKASECDHQTVVIKLLNAGATIDPYSLEYLIANRALNLSIRPVIQQQQTALLQQQPLAKHVEIKSAIIMALCNKLFADPSLDVSTVPSELSQCYHDEQQRYTPLIAFATWGALSLHHSEQLNYSPLQILIGRGTSISHVFHPPTSARGRYHENTIYIAGGIGEKERMGTLLHEMMHFAIDYCPAAKEALETFDQAALKTEINTAGSRHHLSVYSLQQVYQTHCYDEDHVVEELIARVPQLLYLAEISKNESKVRQHLPLLLGCFQVITQTLSQHLNIHAAGLFPTPTTNTPEKPTVTCETKTTEVSKIH